MRWLQSTPRRGPLPPQKALDLATIYLEQAHKTKDPVLALEICLDAENTLYRIHQSDRKSLVAASASGTDNTDRALCKAIAATLNNVGELFDNLGHPAHSKRGYKYVAKWGHVQQPDPVSESPHKNHQTFNIKKDGNSTSKNIQGNASVSTNIINAGKVIQTPKVSTTHRFATIPKEIFNHDVAQVVFNCNLPRPDIYLDDTRQLAYCLNLLPTAPMPKRDPSNQEQEWSLSTSNDQDELERLHNLVSDVITMFTQNDVKSEATVAEVMMLAPVLSYEQYRALLMALINGISQNVMLETHLLEGLAQLMQRAPLGYLDSDDLVNVLNTLSSRLQGTHGQSSVHIYRLCVTVSQTLDAMVSSQAKGLKREQLHEPLAAYLKELKAYAAQALLYIPDDETTMQAMLRRTSAVARGVFGIVGAVKDWDLNAFMGELSNMQKGLPPVSDVVDKSLGMYNGATSLYASGEAFKQSMEEGLAFSRKSAWYPALRGADELLQSGGLIKFKTLVCEAPCRRDLAFQWGICLRLGQIAASTEWTTETRKDAVHFLGEIYKNEKDWGDHAEIKQWVIKILKKLTLISKALKAAESLLSKLATDGDANKQQLYKDSINEPAIQYPLIGTLLSPTSSSLLERVQNKSDVEKNLRLLKRQRMEIKDERDFYIQQYAKANLQASDDKKFLLMDKAKEFLNSGQKVFLVQGESGAGKSTFNRTLEHALWEVYQRKRDQIPLFINLPSIDNPAKDMVAKQLRMYDFTDVQIKEMKKTRSFILICDGYDEVMQTNNLYASNRLNKPGEWMCQMVISCRSEYLGIDYRDRFQPMDRNRQADVGLFHEAVIVPFSEAQIDSYIEQYVAAVDLLWGVEDYQRALKMVPSLREIVENPFILSLSLEVLPRMVDPNQDIYKKQIKRITLYDKFVELWLERGKKRLSEISVLEDRRMFRILCDEGFAQNGIKYLTELAVAIYKHQDGNPVVEYSPSKHNGTWKEDYFSRESGKYLLREASPLSRTGNQYRFVHRSILEYCVVRAMFEPQKEMSVVVRDREGPAALSRRRGSTSSVYSFEAEECNVVEQEDDSISPDETSPLVWRSFVDEPSILQFLVDRVRLEAKFKQQLYEYVELSKSHSKWRVAAANAMTILVRAGESFIEADLRGVQIPGADLGHGIFECAQLQEADLRKVDFRSCWLRQADFSGAKMAGVQFGEWPFLHESGGVLKGSYSPDGKALAAAVYDQNTDKSYVSIYDTMTWDKRMTLEANGRECDYIYSPDSRYIATWCNRGTISVFNAVSGALVHNLEGHVGTINGVAYSPSGDHLASACKISVFNTVSGALAHNLDGHVAYSPSGDHLASARKGGSLYVWDIRSGMVQYINEHARATSVVYSPDGQQIAIGSQGVAVQLLDAASGKLILKLQCHESPEQILYSPDSQEIITRGHGATSLEVWDTRSGQKKWGMEPGIPSEALGVQYSPDGKFAASFDFSMAYQWNMKTEKVIHALRGYSTSIKDLKYSPNGEQIAACAFDFSVRLWDARSGQLTNTFYGHSELISCVEYSPNSHQIASFSEDGTIRLCSTQLWQSSHDSYGHSHTKSISRLSFSPNGQQVASCSWDGTVHIRNSWTGQHIHVLRTFTNNIKFSSDGRLLASSGAFNEKRVHIWDTHSGQAIHVLERRSQSAEVLDFNFLPSSQQIICGHKNGDISVWSTQTGQFIRTLPGGGNSVESVLFSPSGHQVASYGNNRVRVWTVSSVEFLYYDLETMELHKPYFVYSADSQKIVFIQDDKKAQLRDAETGELCYETNFENRPAEIVFSPSSRQMVVSSLEGPPYVVDTESGAMLHTLEGHTSYIKDISYSCDGQYIASCSIDRSAQLWDPESGQCLADLPFVGEDVDTFAWNVSEKGSSLVTGHRDGSIRLWQITKSEEGQCHSRLRWSTGKTALNATEANIRGVVGLSEVNRKVLEQHKAIDDIGQCTTFQEPVHEAKKETSTTCSSEGTERESLDTGPKRDDPKASPLIVKSDVTNGYQFICSKCSECNECEHAHFILSSSYDSPVQYSKENVHTDHIE
ncbi:hypothetical protein BX616_011365 [Lobosporangium transversale]|nr:hypothetical protein BX616_011365 [Lobosporangium transversale]